MATLNELKAQGTTSLKRGTVGRQLGAKPVQKTRKYEERPGTVKQFAQKIGDIGGQAGRFAGFAGKEFGKYAGNVAVDIAKAGYGAARAYVDAKSQPIQNSVNQRLSNVLDRQSSAVFQAYKSGKMSKEDYVNTQLKISEAYQQISREARKISTGPSPTQRASDVAETAVNILTLGTAGIVSKLPTRALITARQRGVILGRDSLERLVTNAANPLEKTILKNKAFKDLVIRNIQREGKRELQQIAGETADQFLFRNIRKISANLLIKRPIVYQSNIGLAQDAYDDIMKGDYKGALTDAAWIGSQLIQGGPIGVFFKGKDWLKGNLRNLSYGNRGFIDEISKRIGDGNPNQIARFLTNLKDTDPNGFKNAERTFRILQETNLRASGDDVIKSVDNVLTHYEQHGYNLKELTPRQLFKDMDNWAKADELAQKTLRSGLVKGITPEDASKYVVVRWDQTTRQGIINAYKEGGIEAVAELMQRPGVGWTNNQILVKAVEDVVNQTKTAQEFEDGIRAITAARAQIRGVPSEVSKQLAKLGYGVAEPAGGRITPIVDINDTRKLVTAAIQGQDEVFNLATEPQPQFAALAGWLNKLGFSPQTSSQMAYRQLSDNVVASLDELQMGKRLGLTDTQGGDVVRGGQAILSRLQGYIDNKRPSRAGQFFVAGRATGSAVNDIRQLTVRNIEEALNVDGKEAKAISDAIMDGYMKTPLELRGLGDKITDTLYKYNPLHKYYSRIQSALRYTYNPFFRTQERVETAILARTQANNLVWNKTRTELDDAVKVLDEAGIFSTRGNRLESSLGGEAAQDQILGRVTANLTKGQKRDLAGLATDLADARGIPLSTMALEHANELDDALRIVVQYPRTGLLASPLARTMNLAFFPMRYNLKVTMVAAQTLAKQPPSVQKAVLHSMFRMRDWLKSDEGISWQQQHADAIQVLKWVTPINSLEYTLNLLGHKPNSMAELGQLGGLPLGLITQILDGQGIISLNRPYVNPKTGDVIPKYIPQTTRARAATAVVDLLNQMFTYPGRTLGLPGKNATLRGVVQDFLDVNGKDFDKKLELDRLTPLQQNMVRVLKGNLEEEDLDALYNAPAAGQFNWYTLPPLSLPIRTPQPPANTVTPRKGLPSGKKSRKKKAKPISQPISS